MLLLPYLTKIGPRAFRRAVVELYPSADVQSVRKMVDLMADTSREILHSKHQGSRIDEQVGGGKDIMSILRAWHFHDNWKNEFHLFSSSLIYQSGLTGKRQRRTASPMRSSSVKSRK